MLDHVHSETSAIHTVIRDRGCPRDLKDAKSSVLHVEMQDSVAQATESCSNFAYDQHGFRSFEKVRPSPVSIVLGTWRIA